MGSSGGAQVVRVNFNAKGNATSDPYAVLDVDHTNGSGPETITVHRQIATSCCYVVHDYIQ